MMKKYLMSLYALATLAIAGSYEYPSVYKDTRIMGMGGANIAVGGQASSLFLNPAGLSEMDESDGIELDLINLTFTYSGAFFEFLKTLQDNQALIDTDLSTFISKMGPYRSSNYHLDANDYSSISMNNGEFAWSIGYLAGFDLNVIPHLSLGSDGLLELHLKTTSALVAALSYEVTPDLKIGLGLKSFSGFDKATSVNVISESSIPSSLNDLSDYTTNAYDLGLIYYMDEYWPFDWDVKPTLGVSLLNIGGLDFGSYYASIPQTLNVGFAIHPEFDFLSDWVIAIDLIDISGAYKTSAGLDNDFGKRLRYGAKASLLDNSFVELTGSLGSYNQALTYGFEARFLLFNLFFSSYSEEVGAYAGQNQDRRYQLSFAMGF